MRKIKFRSWDAQKKQMDIPDGIANDIDGDKYQIMQFTGIVLNGKEVYEGDILKPADRVQEYGNQVVKWYDEIAGFYPCSVLGEEYDLEFDNCSDVIGNIYENPLEAQNDL